MHRGLLSRYTNLRRDFYAYQRHHELPEWLEDIPTKPKATTRQLAELGRAAPSRVRTEETRSTKLRAIERLSLCNFFRPTIYDQPEFAPCKARTPGFWDGRGRGVSALALSHGSK